MAIRTAVRTAGSEATPFIIPIKRSFPGLVLVFFAKYLRGAAIPMKSLVKVLTDLR